MANPIEIIFDQLHELDNRSIQTLMREAEAGQLMRSLKGARETVIHKFMANMSQRAGSLFAEEMEHLGEAETEDISQARKAVIATLVKLVDNREIILPRTMVLPDDARVKTMGTRIEDRIEKIESKLDQILKSIDELKDHLK